MPSKQLTRNQIQGNTDHRKPAHPVHFERSSENHTRVSLVIDAQIYTHSNDLVSIGIAL